MPRKTTSSSASAVESSAIPARQASSSPDLQEKLDMILIYLHRMDKRDRLRMLGSTFRGLLGLIPLALLLLSVWYFYAHGEEFMEQITKEAVRQSAAYTQDNLMEQLEEAMRAQQ